MLQKYYSNIKLQLQYIKTIDNNKKKIDTYTIKYEKIKTNDNILGGYEMSGAIMNKVLDLFGVDTANEEEYEEDYNQEEEEEEVENKNFWNRRKVVNMPQTEQIKMVISQPTTFEQSEAICDLLKEKKSVIVNLEYVNKDVARRIVDVISGAVHALDGHIQKVSNSIFLIAPYNYEITNELAREEIKNKLSVSWLRNSNSNM